jgi:hypothetical protein
MWKCRKDNNSQEHNTVFHHRRANTIVRKDGPSMFSSQEMKCSELGIDETFQSPCTWKVKNLFPRHWEEKYCLRRKNLACLSDLLFFKELISH